MNADLKRQLEEMGPEYREMVDLLLSAHAPVAAVKRPARRGWWFAGSGLLAAGLLIAVGLSVLPGIGEKRGGIDARCEYAFAHRGGAAVEEIIRRQRIDGSWGTDFLTRQNAAALKLVPSARSAYKKALRYLRSKGLQPMSEAELNHIAERSAVNI